MVSQSDLGITMKMNNIYLTLSKSYIRQLTSVIFFLFLFWTNSILSQSESKSQSEIRKERRFQVAGFKSRNEYHSAMISYNLNESFTIGLDARQVKITDEKSLTNYSDQTKTNERDSYLFLQWFPFKVGGLYFSARAGYYKVTLENENWYLKSYSYSNFNYEFKSMNLSKSMYGGGVGYRWVFDNGISLGIELFESKHYKRSLRQFNFILDSDKQTSLMDYFLSKCDRQDYIAKPTSFFISIGYSF